MRGAFFSFANEAAGTNASTSQRLCVRFRTARECDGAQRLLGRRMHEDVEADLVRIAVVLRPPVEGRVPRLVREHRDLAPAPLRIGYARRKRRRDQPARDFEVASLERRGDEAVEHGVDRTAPGRSQRNLFRRAHGLRRAGAQRVALRRRPRGESGDHGDQHRDQAPREHQTSGLAPAAG